MKPCHGGNGVTYEIGRWTPAVVPIPCKQGYHVCTEDYLLEWLATRIFQVRLAGKVVSSEMKLTAESIQLVRELKFDYTTFLGSVIRGTPRPVGKISDVIEQANLDNDQVLLFQALAWQAMNSDLDTALRVVPKRVAQAKAFQAYKRVVDSAWSETDGGAPEYYWTRIYRDAEDAKRSSHDKEREEQRKLLFSLLD